MELKGTISSAVQLSGQLAETKQMQGVLGANKQLAGELHLYVIHGEPYEGAYTFTPTEQTQTAPTNGKTLENNITINPIPNNYGLITWDGTTIIVS